MPSYASAGGVRSRAAAAGNAVVVQGFEQLQRALLRIEGGINPELRLRLKAIGLAVAHTAAGNVPHATGRHGDPDVPLLEDSIKVSTTLRSASIYATAVHGGVQNVGGGPHAGWGARGPHVKRADASHYMDRAVETEAAFVLQEINELITWVTTTFGED
jgi:hypothetical protein